MTSTHKLSVLWSNIPGAFFLTTSFFKIKQWKGLGCGFEWSLTECKLSGRLFHLRPLHFPLAEYSGTNTISVLLPPKAHKRRSEIILWMHFVHKILVSFSQVYCGLMVRYMWWGSNGRKQEELSRKSRWYEIVKDFVHFGKEIGLFPVGH